MRLTLSLLKSMGKKQAYKPGEEIYLALDCGGDRNFKGRAAMFFSWRREDSVRARVWIPLWNHALLCRTTSPPAIISIE